MKISPTLPPHSSQRTTEESDTEDAAPFPIECLPGVAGEMAAEIARVTTAQNLPLAAAAILGTLSASIGAGLEVFTGGERRTRANLFILSIADSGTGKGEAYHLAVDPFEAAEAEAIEAFDLHTRPGLVAELRVAEIRAKKLCTEAAKESDRHARALVTAQYRQAEEDVVLIQRRLDAAPTWKVADVTKEKLAIVLQSQPGEAGASMSSEARGLFNIMAGKYSKGGGDEDFYCSAYSGDTLTVDRVGRARVTLRRPCLSVTWSVQPDSARKAFAEESFTESGLLPRFIFFDPRAEPKIRTEQPEPIPSAIKVGWSNLVRSLVTSYRMTGDEPQTITASVQAMALMTAVEAANIRLRQSGGEFRDIAPYIARWTENAWKLALVLHTAKNGAGSHLHELTFETARSAVQLTKWFSDRQIEILSAGRRAKFKARVSVVSVVLADAEGEISMSQLRRMHGFEEGEIRQLMAMFPGKFKIEDRRQSVGRPSPTLVRV